MILPEPVIGLALAGGGAKGIAHIGVIEVLEEEGINIDRIAGTSIGAIIGAMYALNPDIHLLKQKVKEIINLDAYQKLALGKFKPRKGETWLDKWVNRFQEGALLTELLTKNALLSKKETDEIFHYIFGEKTFNDTKIPFASTALDLLTGKDVVMKRGDLWEAVRASAAIPAIFPPVRQKDKLLVDGGVTANIPVKLAFDLGANIVIAVMLKSTPSSPGKLNTALEIYMRSEELTYIKLCKILSKGADLVIKPDVEGVYWTDFDKMEFCIEKGREAAKRQLKKIKAVTSREYLVCKKLFGKHKSLWL
ncbi:MAG: patatin-like phospholipase family protein [Deltaproteobacteria bacterium]|nr:patatin-like phospholipase family protein [Deltaproteobacteria bacterium]